MSRREFLGASLALAAGAALGVPAARAAAPGRIRPGDPAWPSADEWAGLKSAVGGRLSAVTVPDFADPAVRKLAANPFWVGDQAGLTQSTGWLDAWRFAPSVNVVAAQSAADVAAAVRFALENRSITGTTLLVDGGQHLVKFDRDFSLM